MTPASQTAGEQSRVRKAARQSHMAVPRFPEIYGAVAAGAFLSFCARAEDAGEYALSFGRVLPDPLPATPLVARVTD